VTIHSKGRTGHVTSGSAPERSIVRYAEWDDSG
jgi:hypothetical protein